MTANSNSNGKALANSSVKACLCYKPFSSLATTKPPTIGC